MLKDSFQFVNDITSQEKAPFMCSFDVTSLFTNVPVDEVINICLDKLFMYTNKVHGLILVIAQWDTLLIRSKITFGCFMIHSDWYSFVLSRDRVEFVVCAM